MKILGIETSCDETAAAIIERDATGHGVILSSKVRSQIAEHAVYGGVVPEIAARAHVEILDILVKQALDEANLTLNDIDAIAATAGPGLIGGLLVGLTTAKTLALAADKPFLPINHLEGHALTARLTDNIAFPYLLLLVSGGHSQIVLAKGPGQYKRLGTTIDDALGECFDKTAKLLGLPYPGGPAVEKAAQNGSAEKIALPRPLKGSKGCDFSFSGLKTAVRHAALQQIEDNKNNNIDGLTEQNIADICAAFEAAIADIITDRLGHAFAIFHEEQEKATEQNFAPANSYDNVDSYDKNKSPVLVVAGGVAANKTLRAALQSLAAKNGFSFVAPPLELCSDNAAMIAWAGAEHYAQQLNQKENGHNIAKKEEDSTDTEVDNDKNAWLNFAARARWPLDATSPAKIGSGRKGAKA